MCGLSRASYDSASARSCGTASVVFSVIGIIIGVIVIIILIAGEAVVLTSIPGLQGLKLRDSKVRTERAA